MKKEFPKIGVRNVEISDQKDYDFVDLKDAYCTHCGQGPMDGATGNSIKCGLGESEDKGLPGVNDPAKEFDGMPTFCIYCSEINVYRCTEDNKLTLAKPTDEEMDKWKSDADMWRIMSGIKEKIAEMALQERLRGNMKFAKGNARRF